MQNALFVQRVYWHALYFISECSQYEEPWEKFLCGLGSGIIELLLSI